MVGGSRTGFQAPSIKMGNKDVFRSGWIGQKKTFDEPSCPELSSTGILGRALRMVSETESFSAFSSR
jgi:hypothetical protein